MFSQACVKNSVHRGEVYTPMDTNSGQTSSRQTPPSGQTPPLGKHPLGRHHHPRQTPPPSIRWQLQQTVRILLQCILVWHNFCQKLYENFKNWTERRRKGRAPPRSATAGWYFLFSITLSVLISQKGKNNTFQLISQQNF